MAQNGESDIEEVRAEALKNLRELVRSILKSSKIKTRGLKEPEILDKTLKMLVRRREFAEIVQFCHQDIEIEQIDISNAVIEEIFLWHKERNGG